MRYERDQCRITLAAHINCSTCGDIILFSDEERRHWQTLNQKITFARKASTAICSMFASKNTRISNSFFWLLRTQCRIEEKQMKLWAIAYLVCDNMRSLYAYANHCQSMSRSLILAFRAASAFHCSIVAQSIDYCNCNELPSEIYL